MTDQPTAGEGDMVRPSERWVWLTPARCRLLAALIVLIGLVGHLVYLLHFCPFDLSGDEAQYWDWSRQLDWSYYSKGPLVAYLIRASCALFGDTMPAVRLPALLLAAGTITCAYWLTTKLYRSERLALGVVLMMHIVPLFAAGSMLMTIDAPLVFCWALATCLLAKLTIDDRPRLWLPIGLIVGVGFLAKYAGLLWFVGAIGLLASDRSLRRHLRDPWLYVGLAAAFAMTTPVIVWNAQHNWVSFRHVSTQTGASGGEFLPLGPFEFIGGQALVAGPVMFAILMAAVAWAFLPGRSSLAGRLLLWTSLPFWLMVLFISFFTKPQGNWASPSYFALVILGTAFIADRLAAGSIAWRRTLWAACIVGLGMIVIAHNARPLYPLLARAGIPPRKIDPTAKLTGHAEIGRFVGSHLHDQMFVIGREYQRTAHLAFYIPGQPRVFCAGPYFNEKDRTRLSQYDMWPDRRLDRPDLLGRDAIYVGDFSRGIEADLRAAFANVHRLADYEVARRGVLIGTVGVYRCTGFKGMKLPQAAHRH